MLVIAFSLWQRQIQLQSRDTARGPSETWDSACLASMGNQQFLYLKSEYTYASNLDSMIQEPKMHIIYVPRINVCFHIRHFLNGLGFVSKKRPMNTKASNIFCQIWDAYCNIQYQIS